MVLAKFLGAGVTSPMQALTETWYKVGKHGVRSLRDTPIPSMEAEVGKM